MAEPSLVARLIAAGTPPELIEEVAMMVAEKRLAEQAIERRRENDKDRQSRRRHVMSRDVTDCVVTNETPLSRPPNENNSNPPTHTPENKPAHVKGPAKPDDVSPQTWADFVSLRKRKKADLSETAMAGLRREAGKAGWSMEATLAEIVARGWQGFKAEWVEGQMPALPSGNNPLLARLKTRQAANGP